MNIFYNIGWIIVGLFAGFLIARVLYLIFQFIKKKDWPKSLFDYSHSAEKASLEVEG